MSSYSAKPASVRTNYSLIHQTSYQHLVQPYPENVSLSQQRLKNIIDLIKLTNAKAHVGSHLLGVARDVE